MSINEVMKIGTKDMTQEQITAERDRRIGVVEKINQIGDKIAKCEIEKKVKKYKREIDKIKADESMWMKEAAWFLY